MKTIFPKPVSDNSFNKKEFGFPIDYTTNAGKMQVKMLFDLIEQKNKEQSYLP